MQSVGKGVVPVFSNMSSPSVGASSCFSKLAIKMIIFMSKLSQWLVTWLLMGSEVSRRQTAFDLSIGCIGRGSCAAAS